MCVCAVGCTCRRRDVACRSCVVRPLTPSARILGTRLALDGRWDLFIYLFISFLVHSASAGHLLLVVKQAPAPVSLSLTHRRPCVSPIKGKPLPKNSKKNNNNNGQHAEIIRRFVESKGDFLGEENEKELHQPNDRWKVDPT